MHLLQTTISFFLLVLALFFPGLAHNSFAESAISCHCFKDRSFNAADRFAADGYILATSFNSLLARSFDISKRRIIMFKMDEGVGQDDLLIALKIAKMTGVDPRKFLALRRVNNSWPQIVSGLSDQKIVENNLLLSAVEAGLPADEAADRIADEIIGDFFSVPAEEIKKLRKSGLTEKEMALLFVLVHARDQKPELLLEQYSKQGKSWSEIANNLGVEPTAAGKLILAYPAKQLTE